MANRYSLTSSVEDVPPEVARLRQESESGDNFHFVRAEIAELRRDAERKDALLLAYWAEYGALQRTAPTEGQTVSPNAAAHPSANVSE